MSNTDEVISAFLDDEPFDSSQLAEALSESSGRDVLIELVALRHLVQPEANASRQLVERQPRRSTLRVLAAVAAVLVALVGGYLTGERRGERAAVVAPAATVVAPAATRVVEAASAWQEVPPGRMQ
jgi:type VI protein secretion system component VasK